MISRWYNAIVLSRDLETAQVLIKKGIDVNAPIEGASSRNKSTPLHHAVSSGSLPMVQLLLQNNADIYCTDADGGNVLHYAALGDTEDVGIYELLLQLGADCNAEQAGGWTPILMALERRSLNVVKLLLEYGADITARNYQNITSLHCAAANYRHVDVLEFVLELGFDVQERDSESLWTALHYAARVSNHKGCELLLQLGASANDYGRRDSTCDTPLILAIKGFPCTPAADRARTTQVLLERGADIADVIRGKTVLEIATDHFGSAHDSLEKSLPIRMVLLQYMARRQYSNLNLNEKDREIIEKDPIFKKYYQKYYQMCLQELEKMKKTRFYNDVTIYNVLVDSGKVVSGYARNEELVAAFEKAFFGMEFPMYFTSVKRRLYSIAERHKLQKPAAKILSDLFQLNDYAHPVTQTILSYLKNADLKYFNI